MSNLEYDLPCNFLPWVGSRYSEEGLEGLQVLLLGESHHTEYRKPRPTITREVVERYGIQGKPQQTITKIMRVMDPGSAENSHTRLSFWNAVAYYQYIQESVGSGPGEAPTKRMWEEAVAPFLAVIESLQPHAIVAISKRLWKHLPEGTSSLTRPLNDSESIEMRGFRSQSGHEAIAGYFNHPRNVSYDSARLRIETVLATAREEFS